MYCDRVCAHPAQPPPLPPIHLRYLPFCSVTQVFAPTDTAFTTAKLEPESVVKLPLSILENLLLYHTLAGGVKRAAIAEDGTLYTALEVGLETSGATLIDSVGHEVNLVESDVECSNGYLHYVDGVLMPPDLMSSLESFNEPGGSYAGVFDTFMAGLVLSNMTGGLSGLNGPYTVSFVLGIAVCVVSVAPFVRPTCACSLRALTVWKVYWMAIGAILFEGARGGGEFEAGNGGTCQSRFPTRV